MNIQELKVKPGDMDVSHEDLDTSNTNDYFVTALKVFDYCGADSAGTLKVDALMDQLSPFVNSDKSEFSFLRSLLDPDHVNPEINVSKLAKTLHQYSESQKCKVDLDESFNLRNSHGPQDSDSGISTDGYHLLGELQCELREKSYLALRLRSQLEFTDRQHEEALAALTTERDALRAHVKMLREEHTTLNEMRRDYEESTERLAACELSLCSARGQLEAARRAQHSLEDQLLLLETEKSTLQELLSKSKDECHRINEMYASRQAAILEENEAMKADRAELNIRLQDQEEFMQQIIKEKVLLEMELKDMLNKSNQTQLRMDRSIEISYTEDQMLTALDSLNADSRFSTEQQSVSTQAEAPCAECVKRNPQRGLRRYLWEGIRGVFQVLAVACFIGALCTLYAVTRRPRACRESAAVPWRWFNWQEVMDLLLRIEYVADVPM